MKVILVILLTILTVGIFIFIPELLFKKHEHAISSPTATIGRHIINLEVADTAQKQTKGLGFRESLEENSGMLFVFGGSRKRTFWMRGMSFPIDIIWIREDGTVVSCAEDVPPPSNPNQIIGLETRSSTEPAKYVLELNAGKCKEWEVNPETIIQLTGPPTLFLPPSSRAEREIQR